MDLLRDAISVLRDARREGVEFTIDEDDIVTLSASKRPPQALLDRLNKHSAGVMLLLDSEPPTMSVH